MPVRFSNPEGVHAPASRYAHAALVEGASRRLVVSGQVGVAPDGTVAPGAEAQVDQALANLGTILAAHGMGVTDIVKMTVFLTDAALVGAWRARRTAWLGEHAPASTLLVVAGLADPRFLVEVEAEAAA
jgi:enamine deaminase RidA (YjgF/YER057c/UK114 family)